MQEYQLDRGSIPRGSTNICRSQVYPGVCIYFEPGNRTREGWRVAPPIPRGSTTTTMNGEETCFFISEAEEVVRNTKCC